MSSDGRVLKPSTNDHLCMTERDLYSFSESLRTTQDPEIQYIIVKPKLNLSIKNTIAFENTVKPV